MKTTLFSILVLFFAFSAGASETIRAVVRIESKGDQIHIMRPSHSETIPSVFKTDSVRKTFETMNAGDEAVVQGYINYEVYKGDNIQDLRPVFVIEEMHLISLSRLSVAGENPDIQSSLVFPAPDNGFSPATIPVTTEVASAMTLTTSMLLMESLSAGSGDPDGRRDMRKALFIGAGTMATILFLYEQLNGKAVK